VLAAGALVGQQVAARATRDALFLSHHDVSRLPMAMAAAAALSLVAVGASSGAMARWAPGRVVPAMLAGSAVLLLLEWGLALVSPPAAAVALYLHVALFGATLLSGFWLLIGERFDPHSARRALGPMGAGANAGAVLGGAATWYVGRRLGPAAMFPLLAALNAAGWLALRRLGGAGAAHAASDAGAPTGLAVLRDVPYLRSVAAVVALGAFAEALLDYVLSAQAVARFGPGARLVTFFSIFHTSVSVAAAALLAGAGALALHRFGIAGTVALRPLAAGAGALVAWAAPGLATAVAARGLEALVRNSLFRSGYELLFIPIAPRQKRPVKAILDVGLDRLGTVAGSAVVIAALAAGARATTLLPALVAAAAAVAAVIAVRLQRGYVASLAANLRSGAVSLEGDLDTATRFTLLESRIDLDRDTLLRGIEGLGPRPGETPAPPRRRETSPASADQVVAAVADLRSGDPERVRAVLRAQVHPGLIAHVIPLLARDEIAGHAQRALRAVSVRAAGQLVDALLDPSLPVSVRRRLPPVIGAAGTQRAADGLVLGLRDEAIEVRARCGRALEAVRSSFPGLALPRDALLAAAERELALPDTDGRGLAHVFVLLGLAGDGEAMRVAAHAVRSEAPGVRGTALEYLENVVAEPLRGPLLGRLGAGTTAPASPRRDARDELLKSAAHLVVRDDRPDET
jgi:hypothetical protein